VLKLAQHAGRQRPHDAPGGEASLAKHMVEQQPVQSPVAVKEGVHKHQTGRGASGRDNGIELAGGRG